MSLKSHYFLFQFLSPAYYFLGTAEEHCKHPLFSPSESTYTVITKFLTFLFNTIKQQRNNLLQALFKHTHMLFFFHSTTDSRYGYKLCTRSYFLIVVRGAKSSNVLTFQSSLSTEQYPQSLLPQKHLIFHASSQKMKPLDFSKSYNSRTLHLATLS